jgi:hypothetical protein
MQATSGFARAIFVSAMIPAAGSAYAQDNKLAVPDVTVTAPAAPVPPPYVPSPYGRYRVEEDKFGEVPCSQTRIAFGPTGKCLQGYRLGIDTAASGYRGSSPCDMGFDVVIDTTGKLSIEADILVFDPYKVVAAGGSPPRFCYVRSQLRYGEKDFRDMNQITRRGTNWHNLQINDSQDQWYGGDRLRSIEFSDGPHNCIAVRKPGPVWRGGYVWMMHASICRTDTAAVQAEDVAYVLGSLQMRIHDPAGNLRSDDDRTSYGPARDNQIVWQKAPTAPAPTTPFDGEYRGVSREVIDRGGNEHRCNPLARLVTPPAPLTITNGVVRTPGEGSWEGTVSPQGAVVMRNQNFSRVDAQIDSHGTIRGEYSGELPPGLLFQISGSGTNCVVRFVWQRR